MRFVPVESLEEVLTVAMPHAAAERETVKP
jgi:hypothetical protein